MTAKHGGQRGVGGRAVTVAGRSPRTARGTRCIAHTSASKRTAPTCARISASPSGEQRASGARPRSQTASPPTRGFVAWTAWTTARTHCESESGVRGAMGGRARNAGGRCHPSCGRPRSTAATGAGTASRTGAGVVAAHRSACYNSAICVSVLQVTPFTCPGRRCWPGLSSMRYRSSIVASCY